MNSDQYDAVVYDLDGTIVHLDVDWDEAAREVRTALLQRGLEVDSTLDLWELLTLAENADAVDVFEAVVSEHELEGARNAVRLPTVEAFPHGVPVGVCSLNCEQACRVALERFDIDGHVDVVVGRDSHATRKPDPGPLLAAIEALDVAPDRTLFVGDSASDEIAAERAGVDFQWVRDLESDE